ncbi:hypothetical protein EAS62_12260 [Bradyrhizobium zhanjiangense]|uniref:Transposase n=2 Tax=Bradyrhizobium zhanjiangense TaxID=1325107 RepID=A0ABY0DQ92_9BRAD|nr:hypothetical protein EAS62_12260 [Bradyrhizobium zhanjiangense]
MFAAIEAHKARAMWLSLVDRCCELEILLPNEKRRSSICAGQEIIVATTLAGSRQNERLT